MKVTRTRHGLRFSQHGVVISELRTTPGPTHSVFDVLAMVLLQLCPNGRTALLGFAGGGMLAPLMTQGTLPELLAVDLDAASYKLFHSHCPEWARQFTWEHAEAVSWLGKQSKAFDLIMDDLSVPKGADVVKPDVSWRQLPQIMRARLKPNGVAAFNLMSPPKGNWRNAIAELAKPYRSARLISFDEFENRILLAGKNLPSAQMLGRKLNQALRQMRSGQAGRIHVRTLK